LKEQEHVDASGRSICIAFVDQQISENISLTELLCQRKITSAVQIHGCQSHSWYGVL